MVEIGFKLISEVSGPNELISNPIYLLFFKSGYHNSASPYDITYKEPASS